MTMCRSLLFFLFSALSCLCLEGVIVEIGDLDDFKRVLEDLDEHALVIFDIDYTLLVPCDGALLPCGRYLRKQYQKGLETQRRELLESVIALESEERVTDIEFLSVLHQLQARGIGAMGLSALNTGTYGKIQKMEEWRLGILKKLGIDFSKSFQEKNPTILAHLADTSKYGPLFQDGVLFTDRQPKGKVLAAFFELLDNPPKKIVVIDDSLGYLKTIEQAAHTLGIDCMSFHYRAAEQLGLTFKEEIGKFQFQYLIDHEQWLSDERVQQMQNATPCES